MGEAKVLKLVYTFFLGLLIALFIGFGINTFYPAPTAPEYPSTLNALGKEPTQEQIKAQENYDKQMRDFEKNEMGPYNRNVSVIAIIASIALLALSLLLEKSKAYVINEGVMLGGLLTLLYGLMRGFASQDSKYSFVAVTIGLVVVVYLGFRRFSIKTTKS